MQVPALLRQVIDGRVARLGEDAQRLLAVAAVIGQEVPLASGRRWREWTRRRCSAVVEQAAAARLLEATPDGARAALRPRADPRGALRGHPAVAPAAAAPAGRRGAGRAAAPRPGRGGVPLPAGGRRAGGRRGWSRRGSGRSAPTRRRPPRSATRRRWRCWTGEHAARRERALAALPPRDAARRTSTRAQAIALPRGGDAAGRRRRATAALAAASLVPRGLHCAATWATFAAGSPRCGGGRGAGGARRPSGARIAATRARPWIDRRGRATRGVLLVLARLRRPLRRGARLASGSSALTARRRAGARPLATASALLGRDAAYASPRTTGPARTACAPRPARAMRAAGSISRRGRRDARTDLQLDRRCPIRPTTCASGERLADEAERRAARARRCDRSTMPGCGSAPVSLFVEGQWDEARAIADAMRAAAAWSRRSRTLRGALRSPALGAARGARRAGAGAETLPDGAATEPGDTRSSTTRSRCSVSPRRSRSTRATCRRREAWLEAHDRWLAWSGAVLGQSEGQALWAHYYRRRATPQQAYEHAERALAHATEPRQPLALLAAHRLLGELDTDAGRYDDAARPSRRSRSPSPTPAPPPTSAR